MARIEIPARFFEDHADRDLPTPAVLGRRGRRLIIDTADPALGELESDARYYADPYGPDRPDLRRAAKALLESLADSYAVLQAEDHDAQGGPDHDAQDLATSQNQESTMTPAATLAQALQALADAQDLAQDSAFAREMDGPSPAQDLRDREAADRVAQAAQVVADALGVPVADLAALRFARSTGEAYDSSNGNDSWSHVAFVVLEDLDLDDMDAARSPVVGLAWAWPIGVAWKGDRKDGRPGVLHTVQGRDAQAARDILADMKTPDSVAALAVAIGRALGLEVDSPWAAAYPAEAKGEGMKPADLERQRATAAKALDALAQDLDGSATWTIEGVQVRLNRRTQVLDGTATRYRASGEAVAANGKRYGIEVVHSDGRTLWAEVFDRTNGRTVYAHNLKAVRVAAVAAYWLSFDRPGPGRAVAAFKRWIRRAAEARDRWTAGYGEAAGEVARAEVLEADLQAAAALQVIRVVAPVAWATWNDTGVMEATAADLRTYRDALEAQAEARRLQAAREAEAEARLQDLARSRDRMTAESLDDMDALPLIAARLRDGSATVSERAFAFATIDAADPERYDAEPATPEALEAEAAAFVDRCRTVAGVADALQSAEDRDRLAACYRAERAAGFPPAWARVRALNALGEALGRLEDDARLRRTYPDRVAVAAYAVALEDLEAREAARPIAFPAEAINTAEALNLARLMLKALRRSRLGLGVALAAWAGLQGVPEARAEVSPPPPFQVLQALDVPNAAAFALGVVGLGLAVLLFASLAASAWAWIEARREAREAAAWRARQHRAFARIHAREAAARDRLARRIAEARR